MCLIREKTGCLEPEKTKKLDVLHKKSSMCIVRNNCERLVQGTGVINGVEKIGIKSSVSMAYMVVSFAG